MCEFGGRAHTTHTGRPRQLPRVFPLVFPPRAPREIRDYRIYKHSCAPLVPYFVFPVRIPAVPYFPVRRRTPLPLSQVRMCKINTGFLTCASHRYRNFSVRMRTDSNVILTAHRAVTVIPGAQAHHKSSNSRCASQLPYFQMRMRISGTVFSGAHHTITVYPRAHAHSSIVVPREQVPYFQMRMRASATVNAKAHHTAIP